MQGVIPMLSYEDGLAAIQWLTVAFGFREREAVRQVAPDGRLTHAEMETGHGIVMLATPTRDYRGPRKHAAHCDDARRWLSVPWIVDGVLVHVDDITEHRERAEAAGAVMLTPIEEGFPGRRYRAEDVEGHRWMFLEAPRG